MACMTTCSSSFISWTISCEDILSRPFERGFRDSVLIFQVLERASPRHERADGRLAKRSIRPRKKRRKGPLLIVTEKQARLPKVPPRGRYLATSSDCGIARNEFARCWPLRRFAL